jgi:two-component system cell cycle response regulator
MILIQNDGERSMGKERSLETFIGGIENLPTLPGIAMRILEAVQKKEPDIDEISDIISTDPPLSAKVLRLANSSFYNLPTSITSVLHSIKMLGLSTVQNIALGFSLVNNYQSKKSTGFDYTCFWKNSLVGAISAKLITEKLNPELLDNAFFMGLLQDIGTLTFGHCMPAQYNLILSEMEKTSSECRDAEEYVLGYNHQEIGEYMMKSWGLPETLYMPVGYHHNPEKLASTQSSIQVLTRILHLSSFFIELFDDKSRGLNLWLINQNVEAYGFGTRIDVDLIAQDIHQQAQQVFPIFEIDLEQDAEYAQIFQAAKAELSKLSTEMVNTLLIQKNEIKMLKQRVVRDGMTHLINHQHFLELLSQEVSRAERYKHPLSLLMADIDLFKAINDDFGHLAGDRVIKAVAGCLQQEIRESDYVARYGGEEYAIILPDTPIQDAYIVAERIRKAIDSLIIKYDDNLIHFTISFGIASFQIEEKTASDKLIKRADSALYQAKKQGRNQCCVFGKA